MSKNRMDNGFQLIYWKLSYRRKFIRTLWQIPIAIVVSTHIYMKSNNFYINRILPISIIIVGMIQLIYTYMKWQYYESDENLNS